MINLHQGEAPAEGKLLNIIYEDAALWVVNKPSGLLSVPGRAPENKDSVISRLSKNNGAHAVHRLDMTTSGLMLVAKNKAALSVLSKQFAVRSVYKRYRAIVNGLVAEQELTCEEPLTCDWPNRPRQKVCSNGKPAKTLITVSQRNREANYTELELVPITGRSHQLRVHMQALGYPILGCEFYADLQSQDRAERLLLHAERLVFRHPESHQILMFDSHLRLDSFVKH